MNQIISVLKQDGQLVVSSREVAENFEKQHQHVTQAIENLISENSLLKNMIIESEYVTDRGRKYKEYLLTRDGFSLLVMGFTGSKALHWKLKYIEAFNKMEKALINNQPKLSKELQAIFMLDEKTQEIGTRLEVLENNMTIDYGQQESLNRCARARLVEILGGKESKAYKELSKKVFSSLWNMYKQAFCVNSYKNTAKKDFDRALVFISSWEPSKETYYMIVGANSQMAFR